MDANVATEPVVRLTASAAEEVKSLLQKPENAGKNLRVYVEKGGCSGMQYSMVFDEARPDDFVNDRNGILFTHSHSRSARRQGFLQRGCLCGAVPEYLECMEARVGIGPFSPRLRDKNAHFADESSTAPALPGPALSVTTPLLIQVRTF